VADDPNWPRASAWLAGDRIQGAIQRIGVLGVPLALGSITPGRCDLAPDAIRKALHRYSTWHFESGVDVRSVGADDLGDVAVSHLLPADAFNEVGNDVRIALESRDAVVLLGGDNSVTRPGVHGMGVALRRCALITLDAHLDLRDLGGGLSNGNPVRALLEDGLPGANVVQIGIQSFANSPEYARVAADAGIRIMTADDVRRLGIEAIVAEALEDLATNADAIYVDLDLDVMDRMFVPGTPGSRPGGLTAGEVRAAAFLCGADRRVRVLDLVEFDPTKDIADATALAAGGCLLSFAAGVARR
jgi:arginase family enzyme